MADYSRAGSPGDRGLVTPPGGGLARQGSPNGARHQADDELDAEAPPFEPGDDDLDHDSGHDLYDADDELGEFDDEFDDDDLDDDLDDEAGGGEEAGSGDSRLKWRIPVGRRTLLLSVGTAVVGLVTLIVAVVFALGGIGPLDRPLLISPVGLDGTAPSTAGTAAGVAPKPGGKVPRVVGMAYARAKAILEGAGFRVQARYQQGTQARETVTSQTPPPGTELARHGVVTLGVSTGILEGPVVGPAPTIAPTTTRRPTATTKPLPSTTVRPTVTQPPTTTLPPTTLPPTTETTLLSA